jgi:hypothetical protein
LCKDLTVILRSAQKVTGRAEQGGKIEDRSGERGGRGESGTQREEARSEKKSEREKVKKG